MTIDPAHADPSDIERQVVEAESEDFPTLLRLAGFDPNRDLRFFNWSGVDFSGEDLRGFDFTGAVLTGCRFQGARITGARFDQATVDRAMLREARDWDDYVEGWSRWSPIPNDRHLRDLSVFSDAPFAPEMVVIPPGRFLMGSTAAEAARFDLKDEYAKREQPQHEVTIAARFALARHPVTIEEYDRFCEATSRETPKDEGWGRGRRPVINVSWDDASGYCRWLSDRTGGTYRLPSEAEWEYACRAGTTTAYGFGEIISTDLANYDGNYQTGGSKKGSYRKKTVPVDHPDFPENDFHLRQMHGNVWEWCADDFLETYDLPRTQLAVQCASADSRRVVRGGSWFNSPLSLRSAYRSRNAPDDRSYILGFRPARTLTP